MAFLLSEGLFVASVRPESSRGAVSFHNDYISTHPSGRPARR